MRPQLSQLITLPWCTELTNEGGMFVKQPVQALLTTGMIARPVQRKFSKCSGLRPKPWSRAPGAYPPD